MRIECPECHFAQDVREDKIPSTSAHATCPRCKTRFRLGEPAETKTWEKAAPQPAPLQQVQIACPKCQFSRSTELADPPGTSFTVGCPRCGERFLFCVPGEEAPEPAHTTAGAWSDTQAEERDAGGPSGPAFNSEDEEHLRQRKHAAAEAYSRAARAGSPDIEWESRLHISPVLAFVRTLIQIITQPTRFFSIVPSADTLLHPILFASILCILRTGVLYFIFPGIWAAFAQQYMNSGGQLPAEPQYSLVFFFFINILSFVIENVLFIFLCHGVIRILAPGTSNLRTTARVVAYANAAWVAVLIPGLGLVIGYFGMLVLLCTGLRAAHRIPTSLALATMVASWMLSFLLSMLLFYFYQKEHNRCPVSLHIGKKDE